MYSVRTPNTYAEKSIYSKSQGRLNKTQNNWTKRPYNSKVRDDGKTEIYSKFSKGKLNNSDYDMVIDKMQ